MSDIEVSSDGTISPVEAEALERAVRERLERALRLKPRFEVLEYITVTVGFQEPPPA